MKKVLDLNPILRHNMSMVDKEKEMAKFNRELFNYSGGYLTYGDYPERPKFVARFKYRGPFSMGVFKTELLKNHTPESYFAALDSGKAPLEVLREANPAWYESKLEKFRQKFA